MKYFVHHESSCIWTADDLSEADFDALTEEIDAPLFEALKSSGYTVGAHVSITVTRE